MAKTHSGYQLVKLAERAGLRVQNGKGDHVKVFAPAGRGYMVVPLKNELATGTDHAICRWFRALGILVAAIALSILLIAIL